ncbi:MAG: hypothetical protein R3358_01890, partial [Woeseiaceae bacterium]|nr:hypothetical protein [Woeseiaceae bacterium]
MHRLNSGAALALATLLLSTPAVVVAQAEPDFLLGDWNVASDYVLADGSTEQTTAVAEVREEVIVGSTTQIRHTLVGSREGRPLEVATTFALNPANSQWVLMQADSVAGTVDIAAGAANASGDA